jgi:CubicO group peptidase (beta-lactamase class C family)
VTDGPRTGSVHSELAARAPHGLAQARDGIVDTLERSLAEGFPPGASLLVVDAEGCLLRAFGGCSLVVGETIPTTRDTMYDLASLTKVIVTVTLALSLAEQGRWTLDDPLRRWLPGYPREDTTLRQLLTHTSGLIPHREFYRRSRGVAAIRRDVYAEAAADDIVPGAVSYSDLNYMLLGWALARCSGRPLARLFRETVAEPLGMQRTRYRPPRRALRSIAATELDGDQRLAPGLVWGEVHDGNTWALGGISGHAGLFAPADDLGRFVGALLAPDRHPVLGPDSIAELTRLQAGAPPDVRALGWLLDASDWGTWPDSTYWHTGFTGTSLLVAPDLGVGVVLLMGGVHPVRRLEDVAELRRVVHRSIADALS